MWKGANCNITDRADFFITTVADARAWMRSHARILFAPPRVYNIREEIDRLVMRILLSQLECEMLKLRYEEDMGFVFYYAGLIE